ncbi:MAG: Lrp/AsnC ligand binding domain-containing protein [Candidatus Thorarchaeota archaeon]|nr:Lrp/AsnC ligand binding domain-containing protein [Candidatus Thorarchaeota archaeon]
MTEVIVLINVKAGTVQSVINDIAKIEGVKKVDMVTGPYDIIVYAEIPARDKLRRFVTDIHEYEGIEKTETCVVL